MVAVTGPDTVDRVPLFADQHDRRIVAMALPALGALAVEPLYVLVDTAIIGHLGTEPLAGLALASTVLLLVVAGCNFLAYGTTQRVAHHRGADRAEAAAGVGVQALWLALLLGVPLALLVGLLAEPAVRLLGGSGEVLDIAVTYLRISAVGLPFVLVALVGNGVLRGVADLRTPLVILVIANAGNVVLELIAVYASRLRDRRFGVEHRGGAGPGGRRLPRRARRPTSRPPSPDDRTGPRCRRCSWPAATSWCGWAGSSP